MSVPCATADKARVIRVLIVEDSLVSQEIIARMLDQAPGIRVVGRARDGLEALTLVRETQPDVVCTDLHMPRMDGLELIRHLMHDFPLPVLVCSVSVQPHQTGRIFDMLEAGAVDIVAKPAAGLVAGSDGLAQALVRKVRVAAGVVVTRRRRRAAHPVPPVAALQGVPGLAPRIIGVGASTGGPLALERLLGGLPASFPLPLLCAQHIIDGFMDGLVRWLGERCRVRVQTAREGERPEPGTAYFAPEGRHLALDGAGRFVCSSTACRSGFRPSVDVLLSSLAVAAGPRALGVLLTGMGSDGVAGLGAIAQAGGTTIVQDRASSVVFGMPGAAVRAGVAQRVLDLEQIAPTLVEVARGRPA